MLLAMEPNKELVCVDLENDQAKICTWHAARQARFSFVNDETVVVETILDIKLYKIQNRELTQISAITLLGKPQTDRSVFSVSETRTLALNSVGIYICHHNESRDFKLVCELDLPESIREFKFKAYSACLIDSAIMVMVANSKCAYILQFDVMTDGAIQKSTQQLRVVVIKKAKYISVLAAAKIAISTPMEVIIYDWHIGQKQLSIKLAGMIQGQPTFWNGWVSIPERALIYAGRESSTTRIESLIDLSSTLLAAYNEPDGYLRINEELANFSQGKHYAV